MSRACVVVRTLALSLLGLLASCATHVRDAAPGEDVDAPKEEAREEVRAMAQRTLDELYARQADARDAIGTSIGYAVFSNFGYKILVSGSGVGKGIAVRSATGDEVFMRMNEVNAGLGLGLKKFRQVWVFESDAAFDKFIDNGFEFGGQASATAQLSGQGPAYAGSVSLSRGVWVYTIADDGLVVELTMKGTKYYRDKGLD